MFNAQSFSTVRAAPAARWDSIADAQLLDVIGGVVMLGIAVAPTCFVLAAALGMFGIHTL